MNTAKHRRPRGANDTDRLRLASVLLAGIWGCMASAGASAQVEQWNPGVAVNLPHGILESDVSVPRTVSYLGRKERTVFDRRVDKMITIDAYVFKVTWPNGETSEGIINPEFGSRYNARAALNIFLPAVGRLPYCLRKRIAEIKVHKGDQAFGGGDNGLLFYSERDRIGQPEFDEIVVHEAAHDLGQQIGDTQAWKNAQAADKVQDTSGRAGFVSVYARENPTREDVSESFLAWLLLRKQGERLTFDERTYIESTIPNRLKYLDNWNCNTYPVGL